MIGDSAQLSHIGIVAADMDRTMAEMSASLGVTWRGGGPCERRLFLGGEERTVEMRIALTAEGPPYLELFQAVPGTPWERPGVHHFCYWSESSGQACGSLELEGWRRILGRPGSEQGYFQAAGGPIIEVISPRLRDMLADLAAGRIAEVQA